MSGLYDRILLPLDGSEVANEALPYATQLAAQSDAELVLFHVLPNIKSKVVVKNYMPYVEVGDELQQSLVEEATGRLQRLADDLRLHGIRASAIVDVGDAAESIIDYAAADDIDVIVMCTHGRSGLARWRYGSVASKVLEVATCPVLLVHSQLAAPGKREAEPESAQAA